MTFEIILPNKKKVKKYFDSHITKVIMLHCSFYREYKLSWNTL